MWNFKLDIESLMFWNLYDAKVDKKSDFKVVIIIEQEIAYLDP